MDLNLVFLAGELATQPEVREFESGARLARYLVTVRSETPRRRVDVVPVTWWDPPDWAAHHSRGQHVWVAGTVQRRFWDGADGRRSRIEVVADRVAMRSDPPGGEGDPAI